MILIIHVLLCVQEVAKLKQEDIQSDTAASRVQPSTPNDGTCSLDAIEAYTTTT